MADPAQIPVSIHIRRGDYLDAANASLLGGICTPAYYEGAVEAVRLALTEDGKRRRQILQAGVNPGHRRRRQGCIFTFSPMIRIMRGPCTSGGPRRRIR